MNQKIGKRLFVFTTSIGLWLITFLYVTPALQKQIKPLFKILPPSPRLFTNHLLTFSLLTAVLCLLYYLFLYKKFDLPKIQIDKSSIKKAIVHGSLLGVAIALLFIPLAYYRWNMPFSLNFNPWSVLGNLFSNTWEEIQHRGLIMMASLYAFKNEKVAWLISGLTFAWAHEQYPLEIRIAVGIIGCSFGWIYFKTKNFVAPISAHCVSDWILDSLFL